MVSLNTFLQQHNKWFTKRIDQVSLFYQYSSLFSHKTKWAFNNPSVINFLCSDKFFGTFAGPILLHITTYQGVVFAIVIIFLIAFWFFNGIKFSSSCVFIFYIVFSCSFCLLQMFVICGKYLIEKKNPLVLMLTWHLNCTNVFESLFKVKHFLWCDWWNTKDSYLC